MNQRLAHLASSQFGVFTAGQGAQHGVSRSALHRDVHDGQLWVPQPGVFAVSGSPKTWEQRLLAAVLSAGPHAVASHRSAARLWGLACTDEEHVELTVPRGMWARPRGTIVHRSRDLVDEHIFRIGRLRCTNPLRTLVDLGAVLLPHEVEDALDRGLARRLYAIPAVEWMLYALARQGRRGCGVLGPILDRRALGVDLPDSVLEPRMARLFKTHNLPPAVFHYVVRDADGRFLAELDFGYPPPIRLGIEVDGWWVHSTPKQMSKDFVRQNGLVPHRWHVLRFTWEQVVRQPRLVAETVRAAHAALAPSAP